jgi:Ser/Thr protein kinase RdoA (MazF antagonist)
MSLGVLDLAAREILRRFPQIQASALVEGLGNHGGFSGAQLWRIKGGNGFFCLKAWPPNGQTRERLEWIHGLMLKARARDLHFVPAVHATFQGATCLDHAGHLWDLTSWMPGKADFHQRPEPKRLEAACVALARLHGVFATVTSTSGPCPGISRRLECASEWTARIESGWQPPFGQQESVRPVAERAWALLKQWLSSIPSHLAPLADHPLALQPCLCDIWHDHVLYEGEEVSGLIDFGSVKVDHTAVDLARLLGSMAGDQAALRSAGLKAYARVRPLQWEDEFLVKILDDTGTIVSLANWLKWLYLEPRQFEDAGAVVRRVGALVERVERWRAW